MHQAASGARAAECRAQVAQGRRRPRGRAPAPLPPGVEPAAPRVGASSANVLPAGILWSAPGRRRGTRPTARDRARTCEFTIHPAVASE